jgi:hypothetical protein
MLQCKCTIFRALSMPDLKAVGSDKAIRYRILESVVALLLMSVIYTRYNLYRILKTSVKI